MGRRKKYKYNIGEMVVYFFDNTDKAVPGIISNYDGRYYLVEWFDTVPKNYTSILAEVEIDYLRKNAIKILKNQ